MDRRRRFSKEDVEQVRRLALDHTGPQIAKLLGRNYNSINALCKRRGIYVRKLTTEEISILHRELMKKHLDNPVNYGKLLERMESCWAPEARAKAAVSRHANGFVNSWHKRRANGHVSKIDWSDPDARREYDRERYRKAAAKKIDALAKLGLEPRKPGRPRLTDEQRRGGPPKIRAVAENKSEKTPPTMEKPMGHVTSPWRSRWRIVPIDHSVPM